MSPQACTPEALSSLVSTMAGLPPGLEHEKALAEAARLVAAYGREAVNVALECQNALMERGQDIAALTVLQVITAIWEIEDAR